MIPRFLLPIFFLLPSLLFSHDVTGVVVDELEDPIAGAYVIHINSGFHTHTNALGQFSVVDAHIGDTLQIMHLGYETMFYVIENEDEEIRIQLLESVFKLDEIVVGQNSKEVNIIASIDLKVNPVRSSQAFLQTVPGLFIGQHAGGGKAEQIFLRGFDIDHGTDVNLSIDGMPINMVSHSHGQGYSDMHFIIPETINQIDFGKGPYYADRGNFGTAGYVGFRTKESLKSSTVSLEAGRFNTQRALGMFKLLDIGEHKAYIATEYLTSDGPFDSPQNLSRNNIMGKYSASLKDGSRVSFSASYFKSRWDASGQIPVRSVADGSIGRFGAIDDTEGGTTSRTSFILNFDRVINDKSFVSNSMFYSLYDFELFSNFTFFLNDPVRGDQIRQKEDRKLYGIESVYNHNTQINEVGLQLKIGGGFRFDQVNDVELSRTQNRQTTLNRLQFGDVEENNMYAFASAEFDFGDLLIEPAVRLDYFKFNYINFLDPTYSNQSTSKAIVSPKLNFVYNVNEDVQLFLKSGVGFHSNDARVILGNRSKSILPAAYGVDLGTIFKPNPKVIANVALWYLFLEQEFVYVGDEGVVEPSGKSRRVGIDVGLRYQLKDWLYANGDFNYAYARSIEEPEGADLIPLAPVVTFSGGLTFQKKNITAGLKIRHLQDRAANEDNSIVAEGYTITDFNASYTFKKVELGVFVENLFNQSWNETQFATESRLFNEPNSVEEIHFTPGTPIFVKGVLRYNF